MSVRKHGAITALMIAVIAAPLPNALAQGDWPQRNIRFIINSAPGGAADTTGRIVSQKLTERLGRTIVVENQPAASGRIGARLGRARNA